MNVRSATGYQLARAELYAYDKKGNRIAPPGRGMYEIPVKETRSYVNSTHRLEDVQEVSLAFASLTEVEREIYRLQNECRWELRELSMTPTELDIVRDREDVKHIGPLKHGVHRVVRMFNTGPWRNADIATHLGLTFPMLRKAVTAMNRKLAAFR